MCHLKRVIMLEIVAIELLTALSTSLDLRKEYKSAATFFVAASNSGSFAAISLEI
mgnify:FL=1